MLFVCVVLVVDGVFGVLVACSDVPLSWMYVLYSLHVWCVVWFCCLWCGL